MPAQRVSVATCPEPVHMQFCGLPRGALTIRPRRLPPRAAVMLGLRAMTVVQFVNHMFAWHRPCMIPVFANSVTDDFTSANKGRGQLPLRLWQHRTSSAGRPCSCVSLVGHHSQP